MCCHRSWLQKRADNRETGKRGRFKKCQEFFNGLSIVLKDEEFDEENVSKSSSIIMSNHIIEQEVKVGAEVQVQSSEEIIELDSDMNTEINIWEDEDGIRFQSQSGQSYNKKFQVDLPVTHILMHKTKNQIHQSNADAQKRLISSLSGRKYAGTKLGDSLLAFGVSLIPQCDLAGLSTVIPFVAASILANANIPIPPIKDLVGSLPSDKKLQSLVTRHAVENMLMTRDCIAKNSNVYIAADKGNKNGNKNLAKFLCWYDVQEKLVKTFMLDCDCVDESTSQISDGIYHSLKRFFDNKLFLVRGQCTDSGGGGTKLALARELENIRSNTFSILFQPVFFITYRLA